MRRIRHVANKNIAAFKILNPFSGSLGAKNPEQSTHVRVKEGRNAYVTQTELGRSNDLTIDTLFNQINGLSIQQPSVPPPPPPPPPPEAIMARMRSRTA